VYLNLDICDVAGLVDPTPHLRGNHRRDVRQQAGGKALAGPGQRIMDVQPVDIHQRTCVILGSSEEVDLVAAHL
jgi:Fructose-1-6-bisphosphatase, C-terminal domain